MCGGFHCEFIAQGIYMPFDGIVTANVVYELNTLISGGKIDKVYQPEHHELVLSVHRGKGKYKVFMTADSSDTRVQLISEMPPNPVQPPAFCMLMRKHLQGGIIKGVIQKDTERIIEFHIEAFNELGYPATKKLIVEIMGKHSNITLADGDTGRIIDSIKRVSFDVNRYRQLLPGMTYIYPPDMDKVPFNQISRDFFSEAVTESNKKISGALVGRIMGVSPFFVSLICADAGISGDSHSTSLSKQEIDRLYASYRYFIDRVLSGSFSPVIWKDDGGSPADYYCFDHKDYSLSYHSSIFDSISEAEEYYYSEKRETNRIRQKSSDLNKTINSALDKLYLKKSRLLEDILQAGDSDIFRLKGELIFANIHAIKTGSALVKLLNYYNNEEVSITLDPRLSPSENGQKYYKKYNKMKTALVEKDIQLKETENEIVYLESIRQLLEDATEFSDVDEIRNEMSASGYIRKKSGSGKEKIKASPAHEHITSDGFRILAGRNNKQNDILTLKTASSKDIWFHTKDIPGTHVILFTEGREPSSEALFEAASVAAYYSKGRQSENVPVDYTRVKYVRKPAGAKPGMVIFDHNRTLYVNPGLPEESSENKKE